ncbi:MAG TPA: DUF2752 domain-containing protein [Thermoanaerobaculia bacterium]|nr:DUF2752 domain-containing protein [Thermoanaerobaculia bacterium]
MSELDRSARQLAALWGGAALALLALAPLGTRLAAALPACPVHAATGLPCPGCGTTRAALALAAGDPVAALAANPLAALAWAAAIAGGLAALALLALGRPLPSLPGWPERWRWPLALALAADWAYLIGRELAAG